MMDLFTIGMAADTAPLVKGKKDIDNFSAAGDRASKSQEKLQGSTKNTGAAFNSLRGQATNVSYQLQDVAVQAQMGTSAFTILAQQGGQLLSPFSALAGILATLGGVVGGAVYNNMIKGQEVVEDYGSEIEMLSQTVKVSEDGVASFSDKFGQLASERPEIAISKIRAELSRVDSIFKIVSDDASTLVDDFASFDTTKARSELAMFGDDIANIVEQTTPMTVGQFFASGFTSQAVRPFDEIRDAVSNLMDEFDLSREQAARLSVTLSNINTPDGVVKASEIVAELATQSGKSNIQLDRLSVKLSELGVRAENLKNSQEALNTALQNTSLVSEKTEKNTEDNAKANLNAAQAIIALNEKIALQTTLMNDGEIAAVRLSSAQNIGSNVSDQVKDTIADLSVEYYNLVKAQEKARAVEREQLVINGKSEDLSRRLAVLTMDETDQITAKYDAQRKLISSSKTLSAIEADAALVNIGILEAQEKAKLVAEGVDWEAVGVTAVGSITNALISGDWDDVGNSIGASLGSSIGMTMGGPIVAAIGGAIGGSIFGGKKQTGSSTSVSLSGGTASGSNKNNYSSLFGSSSKTTALGSDVTKALNNSLSMSLSEADRSLSLLAGGLVVSVDDFSKTVKVSEGDLSGAIDSLTDSYVSANVAYIEDFQRVNETALSALERLSAILSSVQDSFSIVSGSALESAAQSYIDSQAASLEATYSAQVSSMQAAKAQAQANLAEAREIYSINYQGDNVSERKQAASLALAAAGLRSLEYYENYINTLTADITETTARLGQSAAQASTEFSNAVVGALASIESIDTDSATTLLSQLASSYEENFYSLTERVSRATERAQEELEQFSDLGIDSTTSLSEFRKSFEAFVSSDAFTPEGYAKWLSAADALEELNSVVDDIDSSGALSSITDFVRDLMGLSADGTETLASAKAAYESALAAANAGDDEALAKLTTLADAYLGIAKTSVATAADLAGIRAGVIGGLTGITGSIPAYANGTDYHQGGWAMVGERGAELVNLPTGASVTTASNTAKMLDNSELLEAVNQLINIMQTGQYQIAKASQDSYKILNGWNKIGLPAERVL